MPRQSNAAKWHEVGGGTGVIGADDVDWSHHHPRQRTSAV
jgi:hypothetical protein